MAGPAALWSFAGRVQEITLPTLSAHAGTQKHNFGGQKVLSSKILATMHSKKRGKIRHKSQALPGHQSSGTYALQFTLFGSVVQVSKESPD